MKYQKIYDSLISSAISENRIKSKDNYYEEHHIIPSCLGGTNDKDNLVLLTGREHFIAHKILNKLYPNNDKLFLATWYLSNTNYKTTSRDYEYIRIKVRNIQMNKISVRYDDNTFQIDSNDERYLSGELHGVNKDKIITKDYNGNVFIVTKNDMRYLSGELVPVASDMVSVKDTLSNTFQVRTDDERYLSGELTHINKDKLVVKDIFGNTFQVRTDDERYLSGELKAISYKKIVVKDKNGDVFQVDSNDERYLAGELVGVNLGFKHSDLSRIKMSEIRKGIPSKNKKKIIYNGVIYDSITEAAKILKKSRSTIRQSFTIV